MPATDLVPEAATRTAVSSLLLRGHSPAFDTTPPEQTNAELIPPHVREACAAWRQRRFPSRPVELRVLRDVFVAGEGLVFERDGTLIAESVREHEPELVDAVSQLVRRAAAGEPVPEHNLPLVLGKKRGAANYGHWMIEMLPMLHWALSRLGDPRIGVLVHDVTGPQLGGVMMHSLRRLGIADTRVRVSGLEPVRVRELLMVNGLAEHGTYMSPLVLDCHDRLAHGIEADRVERLYLRRGPGLRRQFADEPRIGRLAAEQGFAVCAPEETSLEQQIALLKGARVVVGVMGAAMTNLIYAPAGARAALFAPAAMPDTFFWFIANLRGLAYREIRCMQSDAGTPSGSAAGWDGLLDVSQRGFRRVLEEEVAALPQPASVRADLAEGARDG